MVTFNVKGDSLYFFVKMQNRFCKLVHVYIMNRMRKIYSKFFTMESLKFVGVNFCSLFLNMFSLL